MKVLILKFNVAEGREREFETMVAERAKFHRKTGDFQRMYLLRPGSGSPEYRVVAWWSRIEDPEAWVRKETYALSEDAQHRGVVVGPVPHEALEIVREF